MLDEFYGLINNQPLTLAMVAGAAMLAGVVRGFSGFGAALILIPPLAAAFGPPAALPILAMVDWPITLPLVPRAFRQANLAEVIPIVIGAMITIPLGVTTLLWADPTFARWGMSGFVLTAVAVMASGWRYTKPTPRAGAFVIGLILGFCSGFFGMGGPIILVFWLASQASAGRVRANIIALFAITTVASFITYYYNGLVTPMVLTVGVVLMPLYGLAIWTGARLFGLASEQTYRRVALSIVATVAILSLFR